jgi:isoamyl acetate esterase
VRCNVASVQIPCNIDRSIFTAGWYNIVFEIAFDDDERWIARVRREPEIGEDLGSENQMVREMESEVYTMLYMNEKTTVPVPRIYDFRAQKDCTVGCRYIFMEAMPGRPLTKPMHESIPDQHKSKTYAQLADIKIQLGLLTFPKIGRLCGTGFHNGDVKFDVEAFEAPGCLYPRTKGPYDTALEYYYDVRRHDFDIALKTDPETVCIGAWLRLQALSSIVRPETNRGPFPLHHPDIGYDNLLFDGEFNITGVIDWTHTCFVPVETFCVMPLEFRRYNFDMQTVDNLIWDLLEERERERTSSTTMSSYMKSRESSIMACFDLGDSRSPTIVKQFSEQLIRYLYGHDTSSEQVEKMYRGSALSRSGGGEIRTSG